ncbi:MAG: thioredoxin-dependent thiol peroxidase [Ignavibacteriae bacterium]|nr:thioredoxin-dependent thiol peroxidase [Ignavibacteriota bacterium]NOG97659.1 thioredoxin-dependent thiol peroxidase [Ignavibacteriota bacterium]
MLAEGKKAPAFTLPDSDGNKVSLKDFAGKNVVLYFYPKDNTPGCTKEACDFKEALPDFKKIDAVVLGVSPDSQASHRKFSDNYELPFTLLSDEDKKVVEKYGVWQEKNMYGRKYMGVVRTTVIIDETGKIKKIFPKVKVKGHVDEVLKTLSE